MAFRQPSYLPSHRTLATIGPFRRAATVVISYVILGITLGFAAAVQPGPYQTFLISRTLQHGWRNTLPAVFAPPLSDIPAISLALLLLTSLPDWMENALYFVGGFFVLFLAYGAFKSFRNYTFNQAALLGSKRQSFFKALTLNLLNPNLCPRVLTGVSFGITPSFRREGLIPAPPVNGFCVVQRSD